MDLNATRRVGAWMRSAPATFTYAFAVIVTTVTLASTRGLVKFELLHELSTNVHNMQQHPARVLFVSAFWLGNTRDLPLLLLFVAVSAPVEHWLGTLRWLVVFLAGNIGATVITFLVLYMWTDGGRTHLHVQRAVALDAATTGGYGDIEADARAVLDRLL